MSIVAVTGGTGFIGSHLVSRLLEEGYHVRVLTRNPEKRLTFRSQDNIEVFEGDLTRESEHLSSFIDEAEILYHCAGEVQKSDFMHETHVIGTKNLLATTKNTVKHWVQLSSTGVYGTFPSGKITEQTLLNPNGIYGRTKAQADQLVQSYAKKGRFTYTILRPSTVFGPAMKDQSFFRFIKMIDKKLFFFIGKPGATANCIHIDNVVQGLRMCGKKPEAKNQIYNLSDWCMLEDFVAIIAKELQRPLPGLRLPERPLRGITKLFGRIPKFPLNEMKLNALTHRSVYSITKIQHDLNYKHQTSIQEGLRQMVKAWKPSVD
jgi:nucleoside-diphosphate-sugar epimerase